MVAQATETFRPWSGAHWLVIVATAVLAVVLSALRRRTGSERGQRLDRGLAIVAAALWLVINTWQISSDAFSPATALPLHVSDLTMLVIPIALWTCWRWSRAVVYYWGLALGSLAFITPDLRDGPSRAGFWLFWSGHVLMMVAIAYDLWGRGYRPGWRDWRTAALISIAYAAAILPINAMTRYSYGYLGPDQPGQPALLSLFGPWPERVVPIVLTGLAAMALLTLPWTLAARRRNTGDATAAPRAGSD